MSWLVLTFISALFRAVYGVMSKVLSDKATVSQYTQAMLLSFCGGVISLALAPLLGGFSIDFTGTNLATVLLVVSSQAVGNILYFSAIKNLTSATAQIVFSSILLFNALFSTLFLSLSLSISNVFGLLLLTLAIVSVVSGKIELNRRGVVLMCAASAMYAIFQLASGELSNDVSTLSYLVTAYFGAGALVFLLKWRIIVADLYKTKHVNNILKIPLLTALPSVGNFALAYYAYRAAPDPPKVGMLLTSQVVITVLLSYVFLGERQHVWRKVAAAILVIISAVLIKS